MLTFFQFYMTMHVQDFRGNWPWFKAVLAWYAFASMIFAYGFLAYVWYRLGFTVFIALAVTSFMIGVMLSVAEFMLRPTVSRDLPYLISLGAFVKTCVIGVRRRAVHECWG